MAQPTAYVPAYDFTNFQASNPADPLPADKLDIELGAVQITTDEIRVNMALLQRDDGELANASVHVDAFTTASLALMAGSWSPQGAWATATAYAVSDVVTEGGVTYVCTVAHTSGTFATDLAANKWISFSATAAASTYDNATSGLGAETVQAAIDELAKMSGSFLSKSVAGAADVTLTAAEADNRVIEFTGALTGNINVIVPTEKRVWFVHNNTSGSFTLTVKTSAGTGVTVVQGGKAVLYGDATNVLSLMHVSAFAATVLDDLTAAAARTTLELGTMAVENTAAVPAMTYAGAQNLADNEVQRALLTDFAVKVNAIGAIGGGAQDIDFTAGNVVTATVDTSETTFTFSNPPAGYGAFILFLTNGSSQTVNWPGTVSAAPTGLTASGVDKLLVETPDGGTTYYVTVQGRDI